MLLPMLSKRFFFTPPVRTSVFQGRLRVGVVYTEIACGVLLTHISPQLAMLMPDGTICARYRCEETLQRHELSFTPRLTGEF